MSVTKLDAAGTFKPAFANGRMKGATNMVRKICEAIYLLDLTIEQWNQQLNRAQPHRKGRIILNFTKDHATAVNGEKLYDIDPIPGLMFQQKNGSWTFRRLTSRNRFVHLRDLRVGTTLKSDIIVTRLIDGIEDMLKQREELCDVLKSLSRSTPGRLASVMAMCARRSDEAIDISERIKIDWSKGAEEAEETIRAERRARYARTKAKKAAMVGKA